MTTEPLADSPVVVCGPDALLWEGILQVVNATPGFRVGARASSADEVLDLLQREPCEICVLDYRLPDRDGVEFIGELKGLHPSIRVLVLGALNVASVGPLCIAAGAHGVLGEAAAPDELRRALYAAHRGEVLLPQELANAILLGQGPPHAQLSPREWEVFTRLANGQRLVDIARELGIDQRTVSTVRRRVFDKLGVDSIAGLVTYAIRHQLIDDAD